MANDALWELYLYASASHRLETHYVVAFANYRITSAMNFPKLKMSCDQVQAQLRDHVLRREKQKPVAEMKHNYKRMHKINITGRVSEAGYWDQA